MTPVESKGGVISRAGVSRPKGRTFFCRVCGAEIALLTLAPPAFKPVCCNEPMGVRREKSVFYWCEVCGAEIIGLTPAPAGFRPRCCNTEMVRLAA